MKDFKLPKREKEPFNSNGLAVGDVVKRKGPFLGLSDTFANGSMTAKIVRIENHKNIRETKIWLDYGKWVNPLMVEKVKK